LAKKLTSLEYKSPNLRSVGDETTSVGILNRREKGALLSVFLIFQVCARSCPAVEPECWLVSVSVKWRFNMHGHVGINTVFVLFREGVLGDDVNNFVVLHIDEPLTKIRVLRCVPHRGFRPWKYTRRLAQPAWQRPRQKACCR
jgi:hypothetical protein